MGKRNAGIQGTAPSQTVNPTTNKKPKANTINIEELQGVA